MIERSDVHFEIHLFLIELDSYFIDFSSLAWQLFVLLATVRKDLKELL